MNIVRLAVIASASMLFGMANGYAQNNPAPKNDSLRFPITDRRDENISAPSKNPFDLKDPANIKKTIEYDPATRQYFIVEKIGNQYYRKPTYMTFDEYLKFKAKEQEEDYFQKRSNILSGLNKKMIKPKLSVTDNLFNRMFGNGKIDIRPAGNVDVTMGYQGQKINNPTLPERARKNGGFDFGMAANISVIANIGDKLKLPISYNTQANFDFENQLKLDYAGSSDEIIKRIEAGNVSFTSKGSLIPGAQSLFGIKTQLQFGKLFVTAVMANQRAQRQSLALQGGSASTLFEFRANDYEENRHFLMAQYFRKRYNTAMGSLPAVKSQVQILRVEVWVTNRNGSTTETRDIVALQDLGEKKPYNYTANPSTPDLPYNDVNPLYRDIINDPTSRSPSQVTSKLNSLGLSPVQDFEKTFARKLNPTEYYFNPQVGFISLNQPLQSDEVLGIAYQYSYNGKTYQVGEFSQDIPPDTSGNTAIQKEMFLKLLKATSQRTNLPLWDLMMKNVYALRTKDGGYISSVQPADFQLNVLYEEPSQGLKRYLPEGPKSGLPIITLLNLDRLNNQNDPQPDGVFDYIEGYTIIGNQARVIFPLLEPFGKDLDSVAFTGASQAIKDKYVYYPLYDTIKEIAKTYANLDRFVISGQAKGTSSSEISLGAFNVPPGSVIVNSGGRVLVEGIDYTVDYNLGTVKVINSAILNAGLPVSVQFENNAGFGIQQRNYMGLRLDYQLANTAKKSFNIGATAVRLGERPFFTKMNYDDDPIRNSMYGVDASYRSEFPKLTRWLDKLPFYTTHEMSTVTAYGEAAILDPGHPPQIGKGNAGLIYIDDFEGTRSNIDLRFPLISWSLASTPQNNGLFPESALKDSLPYGYNRAKLAWYNIEPTLQAPKAQNNPVAGQPLGDPRWRAVLQKELYPQRTVDYGQAQLITFDMSYYPTDKGPYNYDARNGSVDANGKLLNPTKRWGGIMRGLDQVDFETSNIEYIEFWMQDPFIKNPVSKGGQLYFNLGNISEDIQRDGKRFFENGLPTPNIKAEVDANTKWGRVPLNPIQVTNAFSNDPGDRPFQDVGFDGLQDSSETIKFASYLNDLLSNFGAGSLAFKKAAADPSADNYKNYRDKSYDGINANILNRYKDINNPQGNSPIASAGDNLTTAFTLYPDQEDLNHDNTLNELEEYFQYKVDLKPSSLIVGQNYITDVRRVVPDQTLNGAVPEEKWYLFRIPIADYEKKVGNIPDFKSIRFMRMFFTGFEDSVVTRFAKLELVRNQWRNFTFEVDTSGTYKPIPKNTGTSVNVLAVNLEENSNRTPIPYVIPPGIERVQQLSNNNVNLLQNEQSISLQVCGLNKGDARGVFKTLNLDLRQYGKMLMFAHTESVSGSQPLKNGDLAAVVRIGNDFVGNYYEIKIPLKVTPSGTKVDTIIWPSSNMLDFDLQRLVSLKVKRNNSAQVNKYYKETDADGKSFAILGNPNLGEVRGIFIGVQNLNQEVACTEVWFNELRLSHIDENGGMAATGRVDVKLADLGTLSFSGSTRGIGFGALEARANDRSREKLNQFDIATSLELGKLLPRSAGMSIPVFAGISQTVSTPQYDPYDLDIKLKDKINGATSAAQKDSIKSDAIDIKTLKSISFNNVRKNNIKGKKQKIWSIENVDVSYAYSKEDHHNPLIESNEIIKHRAGVGYNYSTTPKYWQPFNHMIKSKSPWLSIIKDFNLNPNPSLLGFRADVNRHFSAIRPRNVGGPKNIIPETFYKYFTYDRFYNLRWDLTRSLTVDFSAVNRARVDEDSGRLTKAGKEKMWNNFWRGGRTTSYDHSLNVTYQLPTAKIPLLDWMTVRLGYIAKYNWLTSSQDAFAKGLGNFVGNSQNKNATAELDFTKLYNKSRFLRAVDFDAPPADPNQKNKNQQPPAKDSTNKKGRQPKIKKDPNQLPELGTAVKVIGRILTSVKRMSVQYSEIGTTSLAGYMDSTKFLGNNLKSNAPGFDFAFGRQPDTNYINHFAEKGLFTNDPLFNTLNRQDFNQRFSITAQLIPARDFIIDVNLDKTFGKSYTELYKDTLGTPGSNHVRLSPYSSGSFSVSFISFGTLFTKFKPNEISETFKIFEANRTIISSRLGTKNPYSGSVGSDGYYKGYGKYAQNVLIPAFIAAYTGKDASSVALVGESNDNIKYNPFKGYVPRPNWNINYNGLSRIPSMQKIFTNFTISHGYNSTLSMNSFNSALYFEDPLKFNYPGFVDTLTGNFVPYFLVPNITITEAFSPLIRLSMDFTNQLTTNFEFKKSRTLSMSLIDFQLSEARSEEFVVGIGWRKKGFPLPFNVRLPGQKDKSKKLQNDINFRMDFSIRDDATSNSRLDQNAALPTAGQKVITISPSIDYVLNNRINVKLFFDQRKTEPKVSTSPPITTTRAGVQIRISLAQ